MSSMGNVQGGGSREPHRAAPSVGAAPEAQHPRFEPMEQRLLLDAGTVVINEIMYHPGYGQPGQAGFVAEDLGLEYIELYNKGASAVSLRDWKFTQGVLFTFPDVTIDAGGYLVVSADPAVFHTKYPAVDMAKVVGGWTGRLGNSGQDVELEDSLGQRMDFVHYADQGDWATRVRGPLDYNHYGWAWSDDTDGVGGKSLELVNPNLSNMYGQNWAPSVDRDGSPGAANKAASSDIAPMILEAKHTPEIPRSIDPVTVTAYIVDELPAPGSVSLFWRVDAGSWGSLPMFDDGLHGDKQAGDGVYGATITQQANLTIIEFYVSATDVGGKTRTWPGPVPGFGQAANLLYQVDNSYDPTAKWAPGAQPIYRMIMKSTEATELYNIVHSGDSESNAQMNGTFITLDGTGVKMVYQVGIRNRGGGSRTGNGTAQNYHVAFPSDTSWHGIGAININFQNTASQALGSAAFQMAGLAAPDETPVQVRVNGANLALTSSVMFGSYVAKEGYDTDYAAAHWPDDPSGNLYIVHDYGGDQGNLRYEGASANSYRDCYVKQTNSTDDDYSDLINLTYVLQYAPDATFVQEASQVIDLNQWIRYVAADALLGNQEGGLCTGFGDDYGLYRGMVDTRFMLVPWDMDSLTSFGGVATNRDIFAGYTGIPALSRILTHPETVILYYQQLMDLINTVFAPANFNPLVDRVLGGWVPQATIDSVKTYVANRAASVLSQVPHGDLTVSSSLTPVNGYPRTTVSNFSLTGTGDATKTRSVLVNGRLAQWTPRTGAWSFDSTTAGPGETIVADYGVLWYYLDNGTDQGTAWRQPGFVMDANWKSGEPELGYGETDQKTTVGYIDTDPGTAGDQRNATTYFRHTFSVDDPSKYTRLRLSVKRDDGVAVYLNGQRVALDNLAADAAYNVYAGLNCADDGNTWLEFWVDPALLEQGDNVLAAEIHQYDPGSGDITFNLRLEGFTPEADPLTLKPGVNRITVQAFDGEGGTGNLILTKTIDIWYDTGTTNDYPKGEGEPPPPPPPPVLTTQLEVRDSYLPGIPLLVRVDAIKDGAYNRDLWDATATLTVDNPAVTLSTSQVTLRNGVGSAFVTFAGSGNFVLTADIGGIQAAKSITDLTGQPQTVVSGTLSGPAPVWSGIIHVTGSVLVPTGCTLTVQPGTLVLVDGVGSGTNGISIDVQGAVQSLGTAASPVSFTVSNPTLAWGEFHFDSAQSSLFQYTDVTRTGRSTGQGHTGTGPAFNVTNSTITFDHVTLSDMVGKVMQSGLVSSLTFRDSLFARAVMGPEIAGTALLMERTWIEEMRNTDDADGIYLHDQGSGQTITLRGGVVAGVDDDCIDQLGSTILIEDYILRDSKDKGLSQYNGDVTMKYTLAVDNARAPEDLSQAALSMKGTAGATVQMHLDHVTVYNDYPTGIGIQCRDKYGVPNVYFRYDVTNSIIAAYDPVQSDYTDTYADINVDYTDTFGDMTGDTATVHGTGNINADPQFVDATTAHDFHLQATSPAINAGDPAAAADPDLTRTDMGRFYYDHGEPVQPPGSLTEDTVWTPAAGPYRIAGDLTVPFGITLTIMPGTSVFFDTNTKLIVAGRLVAEGTPYQPVRFTRTPGSTGNWLGIQFTETVRDNRISYAVLEYGRTDDGMVGLTNSNLVIDHCTFANTDRRRIRTENSSLIVRNSTFTTIFALGTAPTGDNVCEHIWGSAPTAPGGQFIIENNTFGTTTGHNDSIDVDGNGPGGPVIQILGNTFLGGGDDAMDLEGNAYIEGNVFTHFHKDQWNTGVGNANVLSAGDAHLVGHDYVFVRNTVYDVDHAVQVKQNAFLTMVNNTVANVTFSAVYFLRPGSIADYGRGACLDGDVFTGAATILDQIGPSTTVTVNRSIVPAAYHSYGTGNIDEDARLVGPAGGDFRLKPGSPALGTGPLGLDMGALVPSGARISGAVPAVTFLTSATFDIGGPGIVSYKYRLNGGAWSDERPVATLVACGGLTSGDYTLEVIGLDAAGVWQSEAAPAVRTWTVDTAMPPHVRINEVLASNLTAVNHGGTLPDIIELYNDGQGTADLSGMSLTDNADLPTKYVFPVGTTIPQGGYLVVYADTAGTPPAPGVHLGFGLKAGGDDLYLYASPANGGGLVDSVVFGVQLPDRSIARGPDGAWGLAMPTFGAVDAGGVNVGAPNSLARTGDAGTLKINEWLADEKVLFANDWVELYNPDPLPVPLGGLHLTDDPFARPWKHEVAPLSFVEGAKTAVFIADDDVNQGADHVTFKLSPYRGKIAIFDAALSRIDILFYQPQTTDVSEGRSPNGGAAYKFFDIPTPLVGNPFVQDTVIQTTQTLIANWTQSWQYLASATDPGLGTAWCQYSYPAGDAWPSGGGLLYIEDSTSVSPKTTELMPKWGAKPYHTYYFRTHFTFSGDPNAITDFTLKTMLDDGVVVYLNGTVLTRIHMAAGTPSYSTHTEGAYNVGNAVEETWTITATTALKAALRVGDNVLAAEVHQSNDNSSDIVWGAKLTANVTTVTHVVTDPVPDRMYDLVAGLRVTELMYAPSGGNNYEYIELRNISAKTLDLTGVRLTDAVDFTFPASTLAPGQYVLVVSDAARFQSRYGTGLNVAGQYAGKFSDNGEQVVVKLPAPYDASPMRFEYRPDWFPSTAGGGRSLVIVNQTGAPASWQSRWSWRASLGPVGSPGADEPTVPQGTVVFNEVVAHCVPDFGAENPVGDWIELKNVTADAVDIGGWYLSDDGADLTKYRLPDTDLEMVAGGGYYVLTQGANFDEFFHLSEWGETLYLSSANPDGSLGTYREVIDFGPTAPGVSVGRYANSRGDVHFTALGEPTMGYLNAYPKVGPVVINEINYHPLAGGDAFIELLNISGADVPLYDAVEQPLNTWQFTDGIDFTFPTGVVLPAGGTLLVVPISPADFRAKYNVPASVQIFGPYGGSLENSGETITLSMPGDPEANPTPPPETITPYIIEDRVAYGNSFPWPTSPDGYGTSLERVEAGLYGNDPADWMASQYGGTPGLANSVSARVVGVAVNGHSCGASGVDPTGADIATVRVTFSGPVAGAASDVTAQTVTFDGGSETVTGTVPVTVGVSGNAMTLTLGATGLQGWVKVTLSGAGTLISAMSGRRLDGEPRGGSGLTYLYDGASDLPSGNGLAGGNAVFYVGTLRGDYGGETGTGDGRITEADLYCFLERVGADDPATDLRGAGFGATAPDGQVTPHDIDAFLSLYYEAIVDGRSIGTLPNPGPAGAGDPGPLGGASAPAPVAVYDPAPQAAAAGLPLASGSPEPVAVEPVASPAQVDAPTLVSPMPDQASAPATAGSSDAEAAQATSDDALSGDDLGLALAAPLPEVSLVYGASRPADTCDPVLQADGGLVDLLAIAEPALLLAQ
jgi:hypothetical protein